MVRASFLRHLAVCRVCAAVAGVLLGPGLMWVTTGHIPTPVRLLAAVLP